MTRVPVNPELLRWARERAGVAQDDLAARAAFKKLPEWESGETQPTLKQLEAFARVVHVPFGHLFLSEPPEAADNLFDNSVGIDIGYGFAGRAEADGTMEAAAS